jgi:hypothetical protein
MELHHDSFEPRSCCVVQPGETESCCSWGSSTGQGRDRSGALTQYSLNIADRKNMDELGYVSTRGELGPFMLVKLRNVRSRHMGLFGQIRDDSLLIGLLFVRGHLEILNSAEFVGTLTSREDGVPCGTALSDQASATLTEWRICHPTVIRAASST